MTLSIAPKLVPGARTPARDSFAIAPALSMEERLRHVPDFASRAPSVVAGARVAPPIIESSDALVVRANRALFEETVIDEDNLHLEEEIEIELERRAVLEAGTSLYYARLALDAFGVAFGVEELPEGAYGDPLARIAILGDRAASDLSLRAFSAALRREATHLPFTRTRIAAKAIKSLAHACRRERAEFRVVLGDELERLTKLYWPEGFERVLLLAAPVVALVWTQADTVRDQLAAGQALASTLVHAAELGLLSSILYEPTEDAFMRKATIRALDLRGFPQFMLRFGTEVAESECPF